MLLIQKKTNSQLGIELNYNPNWNLLLIGFVLAYQFFFIFFGLDFSDSFYHINNMVLAKEDDLYVSPLNFISTILGYAMSLVVGDNILAYRICNWIIYSIILLIPFFLLKRSNYNYFTILFLMTSIIIIPVLGYNIFGYDTFSNLFIVLSLFLLIKLHFKFNFLLIGALGVASALATAARLPNLVIIPLVIGYIILYKNFKLTTIAKAVAVYLLATIFTYLVLIIWNYGNIDTYLSELAYHYKRRSGSGHSIEIILSGYYTHSKIIAKYSFFLIFIYIINSTMISARIKLLYIKIFIKVISLILVVAFYYFFIRNHPYHKDLSFILTSFLYTYLLIYISENFRKISLKEVALVLAILAFAFVPISGSDTGFLKSYIIFIFFPALLFFYKLKDPIIYFMFLLLLLPFTIVDRLNIFYGDGPIWQLTEKYSYQKINNIYTAPDKAKYVDDVVQEFYRLRSKGFDVVFYGAESHIFNYLLKDSKNSFNTFLMDFNDTKEIERMVDQAKNYKHVIMIVSHTIRGIPDRSSELEGINKALLPLGYTRKDEQTYSYYIPVEKENAQ